MPQGKTAHCGIADNSSMSETHHLIISYAATQEPGCLQALAQLQLPHLSKLMQSWQVIGTDRGEAESFAPPHERILAQALQLPVQATPWAALHLLEQGRSPAQQAHAFITPCVWSIAPDQVRMGDLAAAQMSDEESHTLMELLAPWFAEDGITLTHDRPGRWIAQGEVFRGLDTAALDRVALRDIRPWLPDKAQAAVLQRLQTEAQMLLYTHGFNDAREAAGQSPINSFWVHGAGALPADYRPPAHMPVLRHDLRAAALASDWTAWQQAWQQLDATVLAHAAHQGPMQLTLCGECHAVTLHNADRGWWQQIKQRFSSQRPQDLLTTL